jgi:hypothetical protein
LRQRAQHPDLMCAGVAAAAEQAAWAQKVGLSAGEIAVASRNMRSRTPGCACDGALRGEWRVDDVLIDPRLRA